MRRITLTAVIGTCLLGHTSVARAEDAKIEVRLESEQDTYLLGQTVVLKITVTNRGESPLAVGEVFIDWASWDIRVTIDEGKSGKRRELNALEAIKRSRRTEMLKPNEPKSCEFRALYELPPPGQLAFPQPGLYYITVDYPLFRTEPPEGYFPSNVVQITVSRPTWSESRVWNDMQEDSFLKFLQTGTCFSEGPEAPSKALRLLQKYPESAYRSTLQWALERYYRECVRERGALKAQEDADLEEIRLAIGVPKVLEGPFPEDRRLDKTITYYCPSPASFERLFAEVSQSGGVPLHVAPELKAMTRTGKDKSTTTLRKFMHQAAAYKATWVPDGDGYKLVPAP